MAVAFFWWHFVSLNTPDLSHEEPPLASPAACFPMLMHMGTNWLAISGHLKNERKCMSISNFKTAWVLSHYKALSVVSEKLGSPSRRSFVSWIMIFLMQAVSHVQTQTFLLRDHRHRFLSQSFLFLVATLYYVVIEEHFPWLRFELFDFQLMTMLGFDGIFGATHISFASSHFEHV